jgi:hypothetical protein
MGTLEWICQDRMIFSAYVAGFTSVIGGMRQQQIGAMSTAAELSEFWVTRRSGDVVCGHFDDLDAVFESDPARTFGN